MSRRLIPILLVGCMVDDPDVSHTPHADITRDPALTALPTHRVPPPAPIRAPGDRPDVTVYGYWPYWGDDLDTVQWDQLTHIAIFNVSLEADGSLANTSRWTSHAAEAMTLAAPWGVKVHLTITAFSSSSMTAALSDANTRSQTVNALAALVHQYGAHGVNVDYEGLPSSMKDEFVAFVVELQGAVDEVFLAMPSVDWNGAYDYDELSAASDGLFLMNYGYHWSGGNPGPISPLHGGGIWGRYAIDWTVGDYRTWGATDDKIIVGLPLYGRDWPSTNNTIPGTATGTGSSRVYASAIADGQRYGRLWDASTSTAYAFPSSTRQLWYDDADSLADKIQYAIDEGLQGVGFWALTYDDADPLLWNTVDGLTHFAPDPIQISSLTPGRAGTINTLTITEATPGAQVNLLLGWRRGSTPVPGCPGLVLPMSSPISLGAVTADAQGEATLHLWVPGSVAGSQVATAAVELDGCRMSTPSPSSLR